MELLIEYPTTGRKWISDVAYQHVYCEVNLEPVAIYRQPCGTGAAASRYTYQARFVAPKDAGFHHDGHIIENIVRKKNKHFKPKDFEWVGNKAVLNNV